MRRRKSASTLVSIAALCGLLAVPGIAAQAQPRPDSAPEAVLEARQAAFNSADVEAVVGLFAEEAVLISGTRRVTYSGQDAIRGFVQDQVGRNQQEFALERSVQGDQVTQTVRISRDDWRALGIESLFGVQDATVRRGRITFFTTTLSQESESRLLLAQSVQGTLWVTNQATNDVAAYRAGTGELIALIPVGRTPIGVAAPQGVDNVYVSDDGSDQVSVISKTSMSVIETIRTGPRPHHMSASADGQFVYVAEFGANTVSVIETATNSRVAQFVTGPVEARTHAVAPTSDGTTLLATNTVVNEVVALDARTGTVRWTLAVGNNPSEVLPSPDGAVAFVSARNDHALQVLDLAGPAIVDQVRVGTEPDTLELTPDRLLVVGLRGSPAQVAIVDVSGLLHVRWVDIEGRTTGHNPVSPDGRFSFVAVEGDSPGVVVIDNRSLSVIATYPYPGGGRPHGVAFDP